MPTNTFSGLLSRPRRKALASSGRERKLAVRERPCAAGNAATQADQQAR